MRRTLALSLPWVAASLLAFVLTPARGLAGSEAQGGEAHVPSNAAPFRGMARIEAGLHRPLFRDPNEPREIAVDAFYLDVDPVTNAEFLEFVQANPAWRRSRVKQLFADASYLKHWGGDLTFDPNLTRVPVTFVSWFAAKAYARWRGKRLPTAVEWEYAAGASMQRVDGENDSAFQRDLLRIYSAPAPAVLPEVGQGATNILGVRDMHGLVWEWVADFNTAMVSGDARNDTGLERQLFCGAGAQGASDRGNFPAFMRYGLRSSLKAGYAIHNLGFRCAKDP